MYVCMCVFEFVHVFSYVCMLVCTLHMFQLLTTVVQYSVHHNRSSALDTCSFISSDLICICNTIPHVFLVVGTCDSRME